MAYLPGGGHSPAARREIHSQAMDSAQSESNGTSGVKPLEFKAAMRDFGIMFPTLDSETIETVLRANNGAVDATIDQLLEMCDNLGGEGGIGLVPASARDHAPNSRQANSPATLAVDNVDSYNLTLASLTPPKNGLEVTTNDETNMYANLPFQDNLGSPVRSPRSEGQSQAPQPEVVSKTSYKYQTAMFKFKNPFMGPLPDDFLRIKSDANFEKAMQYSRQKRKQVENIRNEKFNQNFYSTNGAHADSEFDNIVIPVSGDPPVQSAWGSEMSAGDFGSPAPATTSQETNSSNSRTNPNSNTSGHLSSFNTPFPNPSPSSGAIPKNYNNRSWSGTTRSTMSIFGKKLSLKKGSDSMHATSTLPASSSSPHSTNLTRSRGYTPSTMNLLGDCDDEDDDDQTDMMGENGGGSRDGDDEMLSLGSQRQTGSRFPGQSRTNSAGGHLGSSRVEELSEDSDTEFDHESPSVAFPQSSANQKSPRSIFGGHDNSKRLAPNRPVIN